MKPVHPHTRLRRNPGLRRSLIGALLVAAALAIGSVGTAEARPPAATPAAQNVVHGFATVDGPLVGASIRVYSKSGRRLGGERAATNRRGTFAVHVAGLPRSYRVGASGGRLHGKRFHGHLQAQVRADRGAIVDLNPVTTIISLYHHAHPGVSGAVAENRVEDLLGIPNVLDPGDLRTCNEDFSGRAFLDAAGHGFDALTRTPAHRSRNRPPASFPGPPGGGCAARVGGANDITDVLLEELADAAKQKVKDSIVGWLTESLSPGGPDPTQEQLKNIRSQLDAVNGQLIDIKTSLGAIEGDLKQLGYQAVTDNLPLAQIDHFQDELTWIANAAPGGERDRAVADLIAYIRTKLTDAPQLFKRAYTGGFEGIKLIPAYGQVALKLGPHNPLFTPEDSRKITLAEAYFDSYLVQALNANVELEHQQGDTTRPADLIATVRDWRRTLFQTTYPSQLPDEPYLVDSRTRMMWTSDFLPGGETETWPEVQQRAADLNQTALTGWSVPSIKDLNTLLSDPGRQSQCDWAADRGFDMTFDGRRDHCSVGIWTSNPTGCNPITYQPGSDPGEAPWIRCPYFSGYYATLVRPLAAGETYW